MDSEKQQLAVSYAALLLADDGIEITSDKLTAVMTAAGVKIPPYWATLYAKALKGQKIEDLVLAARAGGGGAAAAAPVAAAAEPAKDDKKGGKKEEKKKEEPKIE